MIQQSFSSSMSTMMMFFSPPSSHSILGNQSDKGFPVSLLFSCMLCNSLLDIQAYCRQHACCRTSSTPDKHIPLKEKGFSCLTESVLDSPSLLEDSSRLTHDCQEEKMCTQTDDRQWTSGPYWTVSCSPFWSRIIINGHFYHLLVIKS